MDRNVALSNSNLSIVKTKYENLKKEFEEKIFCILVEILRAKKSFSLFFFSLSLKKKKTRKEGLRGEPMGGYFYFTLRCLAPEDEEWLFSN